MGFKTKIILILVFVCLLAGITGGTIFSVIMPDYDYIVGKSLCISGAFIVNPILDLGWVKIPLPTHDDIWFGAVLASFLGGIVLWKIKSWKRRFIAFLIGFIVGIYLYKMIGVVMIYFAETVYGMENCIEIMEIGGVVIPFSWFNPVWIFLTMVGAATFITSFWRLMRKKHKPQVSSNG